MDLDSLTYKLLNVAADFGHLEADALIDNILDSSSLVFDYDRSAQGNVHFDLGVAYLRGTDGLPVDLERSRSHLELSHECQWPLRLKQGEGILNDVRTILSASQLALFKKIYG
ncbi:hypothetical protein ADK75_10110 [Streptomyces virginiae]|uniref:Uncharacterized protein n=1 Tax=Streptomyces virginiae TaxID=1961 RepID=A0A0L8MZ90_STRVG|nr:hypothetical protein ADK75_10110 [Streptomyces virginiae]